MKMTKNGLKPVVLMMLGSLMMPAQVSGETLKDAMAAAYLSNPQLLAQRASLRATDENINQARSGWRPTITAGASYTYRDRTAENAIVSAGTSEPRNANITINQPVFRGFQTKNGTREAERQVDAGRAQLTDLEQQVLLQVVTAYSDVRRDEAVLALTKNNVNVLQKQLEASEDRFRVGEITRTDVAQSKARLSRAISERINAEATLTASRAAYARAVGNSPGTLEAVSQLPTLPGTENQARETALVNNPALIAARYAAEAARYGIKREFGGLSPTVSLQARYSRDWGQFLESDQTTTKEVTAQLTVPIYQAGSQTSRIRQAKQIENQRRLEAINQERLVSETVQNSWEGYREATARIGSTADQVEANEIALEGVRQEAEVGSRTTLDVLDAEQELLDSRVSNIRAERDQLVAAYTLLQSIGRLTARDMQLDVAYYDPAKNTEEVGGKWYGWGIEDE